jgi:hypothetical protein
MQPAAPEFAWAQARAAMASGRADQAIELLVPACGGSASARDWQLLGCALR